MASQCPQAVRQRSLDNLILKLQDAVLCKFGFDPGEKHMEKALRIECLDHVFDPVRDYLDILQWDGVPRIDSWLIDYCGAADTPFNRSVGRKMLVAAVRRVRQPGCKFDYMVVLEGWQGQGKSKMLRYLAGSENFSDAEILGTRKQEQQELTEGIWIYEIAELEGIRKTDVTKVKLFISKQVDSARPAYGRGRVDRPRRCIFVATTNDDDYLRDTTGNRRFWPVKVSRIDQDGIERDRDQLWAEAAAIEASGEGLVIPEALWGVAAVEQNARVHHDVWEDVIRAKLMPMMANIREKGSRHGKIALCPGEDGGLEWRISSTWVLTDLLGLPADRLSKASSSRVVDAMRMLGWTKPTSTIRVGTAEPCRGYVLKEPGTALIVTPPLEAKPVGEPTRVWVRPLRRL
jgi:predicted P-loop ATPase